MNFGVVFVLIFYLKSDQMKDGFVQCLTSACLVDVGFGGTSIKSCKRYFTESFHTKAVELMQSCRSRCLADRSVWGGRIRRDYLEFYVIQGNLPCLPAPPAFPVLCRCLPGAKPGAGAVVPEPPPAPLGAWSSTAVFSWNDMELETQGCR